MNPYIYCTVLSVLSLAGTLYFAKRRILDFRYSIFWVSISVILIFLSLNVNLVEGLAKAVGISYAPAFLFVTGMVFLLCLIFYLNLAISKIQSKITLLTQEIAIIKSCSSKGEVKG